MNLGNGWHSVRSRGAEYLIDAPTIARIVRSYYRNTYQKQFAKPSPSSSWHWYRALSLSLPDIVVIDVDWTRVKAETDSSTHEWLKKFGKRVHGDAPGVAYELDNMIDRSAKVRDEFLAVLADAQTQNTNNMASAVGTYGKCVASLKFLRDTCATAVQVGATVIPPLKFVSAGMVGFFEFQDTGSIAAGTMEGAGSLAFASFTFGKEFKLSEEMTLALIQAEWKTDTEIVAGKDVDEAIQAGASKLSAPLLDHFVKLPRVNGLLEQMPVPFSVKLVGIGKKHVPTDFRGKMVSAQVQLALEKSEEAVYQSAKEAHDESKSESVRPGSLVKSSTFNDHLLLDFAFVNMTKGIGRGW